MLTPEKYAPFPPIAMTERQWPSCTLSQAPIWMSTDLRDGNQALLEPMNGARKLRLFNLLCAMGFKEIEVAFPSASQTDFDFVRQLIEGNHIPADVTIEVITQAREHLIRRTMESLRGAKRAIVHVYNATAKPWRETVFGMSQSEIIQMAVDSVQLVQRLAREQPETEFILEYSPETFTATELDFSLAICDAVSAAWGASPERKMILNLPTTVEMATPNVYADQIEWMHRRLARRNGIILSIHPHNDRGTAVASAELALMAGAERVEGCLFGNGERTGNVDLVTLALNLYTQGVDPQLDLSDINAIARTIEYCNQLPVHPRHPYAGDLVFTAFSGSHQDAIKKGLAAHKAAEPWTVPYLPIDPADLGRSYESVIRVNSQSGKGGIAYLMESEYGITLPRRLQVEFAGLVQQHADAHGGEVDASTLWSLFEAAYLSSQTPLALQGYRLFESTKGQGIHLDLLVDGVPCKPEGVGNGPIHAAVNALAQAGFAVAVRNYEERMRSGANRDAAALAYALIEVSTDTGASSFGAGMDEHIVSASIHALVNAINRAQAASRSAAPVL